MVYFGKAEAQQILAVAGAEESGAGYGGHSGDGQQVAGFLVASANT